MAFSFSFRPPGPSARLDHEPPLPPDADDYRVAVIVGCGHLAEVGEGEFAMRGFGDDQWNLDIAYDMAVFMEQLPALSKGIGSDSAVEVDLYSQGVERTLTFLPAGSSVTIRCVSRTEWSPDPDTETVDRAALTAMIRRVATDFARGLHTVGSSTAGHPLFEAWRRGDLSGL